MIKTNSLSHWDYIKIAIPFIISTLTQPLLAGIGLSAYGIFTGLGCARH